jgi:hypothetical protein
MKIFSPKENFKKRSEMKTTALQILVLSFVSAAIGYPYSSSTLKRRAQTNLVLATNSGQLSRHDSAAVNGLILLSAQPKHPMMSQPSALHMLPENLMIAHVLPHLSFKEAMNLADKRLTEQDIITHCDKSNAQEIIAYIFRDLGSTDHGSTDEVRLKNLRILLNSEQVQEQIQKDNMAAVHNRQILNSRSSNQMVAGHLKHHLLLDSLQAAVNDMAQNGKSVLLREVFRTYPLELSEVTFTHETIYVAAVKGDSFTVNLILARVLSKLTMPKWQDLNSYNYYILHAFEGSASGEHFEMFKQLISRSNPSAADSLPFPLLTARDLLNKDLRSWMEYVRLNSHYIIDKENAIAFYVKRFELEHGNPIKPTVENLQYLMHLPSSREFTIKGFLTIMLHADFDIQEHLARQLLDPDLRFRVREHVTVGSKRRVVDKHVSGLEALNYAIDMANSYKANTYNHVRAALQKVKNEFEPFSMRDLQTNQEANADLSDFFENTILLS